MRKLIPAVAMALIGACASPGTPPGGPIDTTAPQLIAVAPESGQVNVRPRAVTFRFDEVVSERPPAVPSLGALFLISPQEGAPVVDWSRSEISVRPRRGWRPNTVYTVVMLPGIADLRGNVSNIGVATVFATGGEIPDTRIAGRVWDWPGGVPARGALVQAITPDSIVYVTAADSVGHFTLAHLPRGNYLLQAIIDENQNRALDPQERFDSATVALTDSVRVELLAFTRDSLPPRMSDVTAQDSMTLLLRFDLPLDPMQTLAVTQFRVVGPDTIPLAVRSAEFVRPAETRQVADTVVAARSPRPVPPRAVRLELATPLRPGDTYRVWSEGVLGLTGLSATTEREVRAPAPRETPERAAPPPP